MHDGGHEGRLPMLDGLPYLVMMELRWCKPGCNPRKLHLIYTPETSHDVQMAVQQQVFFKDRWDPEARQDAMHGKAPKTGPQTQVSWGPEEA